MVFHHASLPCELSGHVRRNALGMEFGDTRNPQYLLTFDRAGREVYRVWYDDLRRVPDKDVVTLAWQDTDWPTREYFASDGDWTARRRRLFDGNGDGRLDRDEATAASYFYRLVSERPERRRVREVTFLVVEQMVVLSLPE